MRKIRSIYIASAASLLLGAACLRADIPVVDFTSVNPSNNFTNNAWSLGWSFTTNTAITVSALGYYNANLTGGVGLGAGCNCGDVGIFNSSGDLLASTTVTSSDPVTGFFNYQAITPLQLAAGQMYYILAETGSSDYTWGVTGLTVNPVITFDSDAYVSGSTLAFGTTSSGYNATNGGAWFGPNFLASPTSASAPEPSTLLLFGTVSVATLWVLRLRRRRSHAET
jgi:Domain of unknown function (DUF4082)/PEP-CTERM motif